MPPLISVPCWQGLSYAFDPARAALLVIDMQRDFLGEGGIRARDGEDISALRKIIPAVAAVLDAARQAHLSVIHTIAKPKGWQYKLPSLNHYCPIGNG